jgi:hypothetical protein
LYDESDDVAVALNKLALEDKDRNVYGREFKQYPTYGEVKLNRDLNDDYFFENDKSWGAKGRRCHTAPGREYCTLPVTALRQAYKSDLPLNDASRVFPVFNTTYNMSAYVEKFTRYPGKPELERFEHEWDVYAAAREAAALENDMTEEATKRRYG